MQERVTLVDVCHLSSCEEVTFWKREAKTVGYIYYIIFCYHFIMAATVKIGAGSICPGCDSTPPQEQCVKCFICHLHYHAVCDGAVDAQLGSKTLVKTFVAASTKSNFKFFCDVCLTTFEQNLVATEDQKISGLVDKVNSMEGKLNEITKLLSASPGIIKEK